MPDISTEREAWAVHFFYEHGGYSYRPETETPEQGRLRCALALAEAEAQAQRLGWWTDTEPEQETYDTDDAVTIEKLESGEYVNLCVILWGPPEYDGGAGLDRAPELLGSLGMVVVESESDPYIRVVGAEMASEALASIAARGEVAR